MKLNRCPFCRSEDVFVRFFDDYDGDCWQVECNECLASGSISDTEEGAIISWNDATKKQIKE